MITTIKINNKEYEAKLNGRALVKAEKELGTNPINIFMNMAENQVPQLGSMMVLFKCALQERNKDIDEERAFELYDEFVDDGNGLAEFINLVLQLFIDAGFMNKMDKEPKN